MIPRANFDPSGFEKAASAVRQITNAFREFFRQLEILGEQLTLFQEQFLRYEAKNKKRQRYLRRYRRVGEQMKRGSK